MIFVRFSRAFSPRTPRGVEPVGFLPADIGGTHLLPFPTDASAHSNTRKGAHMQFWNDTTGEVRLSPKTRLYAHMSVEELLQEHKAFANAPLADAEATVLPFPAFDVPGGRLSCICFLQSGRLHVAEFTVVGVGKHLRRTAERQRAFLFQCLRAADPYPDSHRGVLLRCPFGTALVTTDPRGGEASLRLTYR